MKKLTLIRHGQVHGNQNHCFIGQSDPPLTDQGREDLKNIKRFITRENNFCVLSSPSLRARQSCDILFNSSTIDFIDDLQEIDFGSWDGLNYDEVKSKDPELCQLWEQNSSSFQFPDGEKLEHFYQRVELCCKRIINNPHEHIIIVSHGGVIRHILCFFLGLDFSKNMIFQISPASLTRMKLFGDKGVLNQLNFKWEKL